MVVLEILGALGGGAIIIGAFAQWLGKYWASHLIQDAKAKLDSELESYKVGLRKSEFWFEREFEAAKELNSIYRDVIPRLGFPDMDFSDACDQIAMKFDELAGQLRRFLKSHGPVIPEEVVSLVQYARNLAEEGALEVPGFEVSRAGNECAKELVENLAEAKTVFDQTLRGQVKN